MLDQITQAYDLAYGPVDATRERCSWGQEAAQ